MLDPQTSGLMSVASQQITPSPMGSRTGVDILGIQNDLRNMSDEQLNVAMQSGTPTYLVASEKNRRVNMRKDFETRQAQQERTVVEDLFSNQQPLAMGRMQQSVLPRPQGLQSLPGSPEQPVMQMQEGGLVFNPYIIDRIKRSEDFRDTPYQDTNSLATGYGFNIPEGQEQITTMAGDVINVMEPITEEQGEALLRMRLNENVSSGKRLLAEKGIDYDALPLRQQNALADLFYQAGAGIVNKAPNLIKALQEGDTTAFSEELLTTGAGFTKDGELIKTEGTIQRALDRSDISKFGKTLEDLYGFDTDPEVAKYIRQLRSTRGKISEATDLQEIDDAGLTTERQRKPSLFSLDPRRRYDPSNLDEYRSQAQSIEKDLMQRIIDNKAEQEINILKDQNLTPKEFTEEKNKVLKSKAEAYVRSGIGLGSDSEKIVKQNNQSLDPPQNLRQDPTGLNQKPEPPLPVVSDTDKDSARQLAFLEAALRIASSDSPTIAGALGDAVPAIQTYRDELDAIEQRKLTQATAEFYGGGKGENAALTRARQIADNKIELLGTLANKERVVASLKNELAQNQGNPQIQNMVTTAINQINSIDQNLGAANLSSVYKNLLYNLFLDIEMSKFNPSLGAGVSTSQLEDAQSLSPG